MEPPVVANRLLEEITCGICIDVYQDPLLLQCSHSFCRKCIEDIERRATAATMNCPLCRSVVPVGKGIPNTALRNIAEQSSRKMEVKREAIQADVGELQRIDIETFVGKQLSLLELEQQAESKEVKDENLKEMVQRGAALLRLRLDDTSIGLGGRALLRLCPSSGVMPAHRFQPGDIVALRPTDVAQQLNQQEDARSGVVFSVADAAVTVALPVLDLPSAGPFNLLMLTNDITYRRLRNALEQLRTRAERSETTRVTDVLFGRRTPAVGPMQPFEPLNAGLNEPQRDAIAFALACNDVALLHGPPGTGKTTTVVELILQAVRRGARVLACAPSNIAVDNIVERLAQYPKTRILRLGHPARLLPSVLNHSLDVLVQQAEGTKLVNDVKKEIKDATNRLAKARGAERRELIGELKLLRKEVKRREKTTIKALVKDSQVVLATITGCDDKLLHDSNDFDLVVIDEAAQALEAACWIAIPKGQRLVLAGDHRQLPPTVHSEEAARAGLTTTLFDRLMASDNRRLSRMLTIQYRMHERIMSFSSRELYEGRLVAHESVARHLLCDLPQAQRTDETQVPLVFIDTAGCNIGEDANQEGASKSNEGEVDIVARYVQRLRDAGVLAQGISVLTPYNAQVDKLRLRLLPLHPGLEIGTVDGMQGREREAVVLSLVRSNAQREVGFLADDRRLNVGITRARRHLCIVADSDTISTHPFLARLVRYCETNGEYNGADLYLPEDRPFYGAAAGAGAPRGSSGAAKHPPTAKKKTNKPAAPVAAKATSSKAAPKQAEEALREEAMAAHLKEQIAAFLTDTSRQELVFPISLSSYERMLVHSIAEELHLPHHSRGDEEAGTRQVVITRPAPKAQPPPAAALYVGPPKAAEKKKEAKSAATKAETKPAAKPAPAAAEKPAAPKAKLAQLPIEDLPEEEGEEGEITKSNASGGKSQASKPKKKKKKKKPASKLPETEADIDALLESYKTNVCGWKGCTQQGVELLGRICAFCRLKYCYNHALPEVHGCGEEAKKHARAEWFKSQEQTHKAKPLSADRRAILQRELDKKIDKATDARSKKKPAGKK